MSEALWYPSVADILAIHDAIVTEYPDTARGVRDQSGIEYAVHYIQEGSFDRVPATIHGKAFHLLRLLVANHPFVDGNKRTALNLVFVFYFLNEYRFQYDHEIRDILKLFATDEANVDQQRVLEYLQMHTAPIVLEDEIVEWRGDLLRFGVDRLSKESSDPND